MTLITTNSLSSSPSTSTSSITTDGENTEMDEDYDIIMSISLTPYRDDQASDYLSSTYTRANKVTLSSSALDFHIAHGPYSIYLECPEWIRMGPSRQSTKQADLQHAKPRQPATLSGSPLMSEQTSDWAAAAASGSKWSPFPTPASSPSSTHPPSLPTTNSKLAFPQKPNCTCWRCNNAGPGDPRAPAAQPASAAAPPQVAAISPPMMYEQALEEYDHDHKDRGGFLLIAKPVAVAREAETGATARLSYAPPRSYGEAQDAHVRSLSGTSSDRVSCAPPSSFEEAQEDFQHDASGSGYGTPALSCVPPASYVEAQEDYHHDGTADDANVDGAKSTHKLVYVKKAGCACWYCGGSNVASAQYTPNSSAPYIPPTSHVDEAQENYRLNASTDYRNAAAVATEKETKAARRQNHTLTKEEEHACRYCGEVPRSDRKGGEETEQNEPGCVAYRRRSTTRF